MGQSLRFNAPVGRRHRVACGQFAFADGLRVGVYRACSGFVLGVVVGFASRWRFDRIVRVYCYVLASTPTFWLGLLALDRIRRRAGVVSRSGFPSLSAWRPKDVGLGDILYHMALPALVLSFRRRGEYRVAYAREDDRRDGERLYALRPRPGPVALVGVSSARPAQRRAAGHHAAVRIHFGNLRRVGPRRAGVLVSGSRPGGRHGGPRRRRPAARGHRARIGGHRVRRKSGRRTSFTA